MVVTAFTVTFRSPTMSVRKALTPVGGVPSIFDWSFSEADSEGADLPQYRPFSKVLSERAQALAET